MSAPYAPGGCEDRQRNRFDHRHEQRAGGVRQLADLGDWLEQPVEVGVGGDHPGDRALGVREERLEGREIGCAGGVSRRNDGDLLELEPAAEVRLDRGPDVRVHRVRNEHPLAPRLAAGHERGLGGRGRTVVVRGGHHVEPDQLRDQRLVLVDALQRALADFRLIRRVGRVPLPAEQELVDRGRRPVAVDAGAEERHHVGQVPGGQRLEASRQLELGLRSGKVDARRAEGFRDVREQFVDRRHAERRQHSFPVAVGVRSVRHRRQPSAIRAS